MELRRLQSTKFIVNQGPRGLVKQYFRTSADNSSVNHRKLPLL